MDTASLAVEVARLARELAPALGANDAADHAIVRQACQLLLTGGISEHDLRTAWAKTLTMHRRGRIHTSRIRYFAACVHRSATATATVSPET